MALVVANVMEIEVQLEIKGPGETTDSTSTKSAVNGYEDK